MELYRCIRENAQSENVINGGEGPKTWYSRHKGSFMMPRLFWCFSDHAIFNTFSVGHLSDYKGNNSNFLKTFQVWGGIFRITVKCKLNKNITFFLLIMKKSFNSYLWSVFKDGCFVAISLVSKSHISHLRKKSYFENILLSLMKIYS